MSNMTMKEKMTNFKKSAVFVCVIAMLSFVTAVMTSCSAHTPKALNYLFTAEGYSRVSPEDAQPSYSATFDGFSIRFDIISKGASFIQVKMLLQNDSLPSISYAPNQVGIQYGTYNWDIVAIDAQQEHKSLDWECVLEAGEREFIWVSLNNPEAKYIHQNLTIDLGEVTVVSDSERIHLGRGPLTLADPKKALRY